MNTIKGLFVFTMFIFGALLKLDSVKYPHTLMLINRILSVAFLIYLLK